MSCLLSAHRRYRLPLAIRLFSSTNQIPQRFLPFEEAREWARSLGLTRTVDWRSYPYRRPDVPANPAFTYKDQFLGYRDWLGYFRAPRWSLVDRALELPLAERAPKYAIHYNGLQALLDQLSCQTQLRFVVLPRGCDAHVIFQSSEAAAVGRDAWCGLFLAVGNGLSQSGRQIVFSGYPGRGADSIFVALHPESGRCLVIPPDEPRPAKVLVPIADAEIESKYTRFLSDIEHLEHQLEQFFLDGPKFSKSQWLSRALGDGRHHETVRTMAYLNEAIYGPLGLDLTFPITHSIPICNSFINGIRVIHRNAAKMPGNGNVMRCNLVKMMSGAIVPLHEDDAFDLAIMGVREEAGHSLSGFYVFPKQVLIDRNVVSTSTQSGVVCTTLYPPNRCTPKNRQSQSRVEWQAQFYIDLSEGPEGWQSGRENFLQLMRDFEFLK